MRCDRSLIFVALLPSLAGCFDPEAGDGTDSGTGTTGSTGATEVGTGPGEAGPSTGEGSTAADSTTGPEPTTNEPTTDETTDGTTDTGTTSDASTGSTGLPAGWQARRRLDFVASVLDDGLTDFPVLVALNAARIEYDITADGGADLRFYDRSENPIPFEIESWDPSGESVVWVRIPEIDANDDHFFMDYGNLAAADAQDAQAVWAGVYEAVWHFADDPAGGVLVDSTGNGHDGAFPAGSDASSADGRVGRGISFDGDDVVTVPDAAGLDLLDEVTLEGWVSPIALPVAGSGIVERSFYYSLEASALNNPAAFGIRGGGLTFKIFVGDDLPLAAWSHLAGTYEAGTQQRIFLDGALADSIEPVPAPIPDNDTPITIGGSFSGTLDEVRVFGSRVPDSWLTAQHESMTDQLLTFGDPIDPPA